MTMMTRKALAALAFSLSVAAVSAAEPAPILPTRELQMLAATLDMLRRNYATQLSSEELVMAALRGMLREVDPEGGEYFSEDDLKDMRLPPGTGSIGTELLARKDQIVIVAPIAGAPAEQAGVRSGDVLFSIDGRPMKGLSLRQVSELLRGPVGSKMELALVREGETALLRLPIERKVVFYPSAHLTRPQPDVAVLRVPRFGESTLAEVSKLLVREWQTKPFKGMVLDLRRSSGGLLETGIGLSALFLPPGSLVAKLSGRLPEANIVFRAEPSHYLRHRGNDPLATVPQALRALPLVVLVDEGTAAGAEIVVAALRDHQRAVTVGRKTFGRASIQTQTRLPEGGAVKFTTAFWEPPSGERIHHIGIVPDRVVERSTEQHELDAAIAALRSRF